MIATHAVPMTTAADLTKRQAWVEQCFTTTTALPLLYERASAMIAIWRRAAAPLLYGDYYPQTPFNYHSENAETSETRTLSDHDLHRDGFPVTLPARSGVIWFYQRTHR